MSFKRHALVVAGFAAAAAFAHPAALAQNAGGRAPQPGKTGAPYPHKPVRMIVAFAAGGAPDTLARLLGQKLAEQMGQPVIVDNRPGATGTIGADLAAKAPPDGYTLFNATMSLTIAPAFGSSLGFDPAKSYAPVAMLASVPLVLVVHPGLPAQGVRELVAYAKAHPGKLNYASVGTGSLQHVTTELLQLVTGVKLVHVPYKSGAAVVTAVLSNEAQLGFPAIPPALSQVKAAKLRAVAVTSAKRASSLPDTPTFVEAGYPAIQADNWNAILAPAGTPKAIVDRLHTEIARAAQTPELVEQFARQGAEVNIAPPDVLAATIRAEVDKWKKVVAAAGIPRQ